MTSSKDKWRFAIGTTSRVPDQPDTGGNSGQISSSAVCYYFQDSPKNHSPKNSGDRHYFMCDIDNFEWNEALVNVLQIPNHVIIQRTPHGWHIYTDLQVTWKSLVILLKKVGADPAWVSIGESRGYYFLADKSEIQFSWPVEHMVLHYGEEKAQDSEKTRLLVPKKGNRQKTVS
jgi:hypothetical protein